MAKRVKFNPTYNKREQKVDTLFEEILKELPEETRQEMESMGIHSFDELYEMMLSVGIDPMKMMDYSLKHKEIPADFNPKDVMLDEESYEDDNAELLELRTKKRKTANDKERLEWYDITDDFDPDYCDLEWLQGDVDDLCERIKEE